MIEIMEVGKETQSETTASRNGLEKQLLKIMQERLRYLQIHFDYGETQKAESYLEDFRRAHFGANGSQ